MRTLFVTDPPPAVQGWLARRRAMGQDRLDEVWEGEYRVARSPHWRHARVQYDLALILAPLARAVGLTGTGECNIGTRVDYRVPDQAYFRDRHGRMWNSSASIVVEVVSPGDDSRQKLPFYFARGIEEVLMVDPDRRTVDWFVRGDVSFVGADGSGLLGITSAGLAAAIDWPA